MFRLVGSTESEHSFAASPRIFWPLALTFTWILVNELNCEIIPGEVSIFRGAAGGLSYVSRGSFRVTLVMGASWADKKGTNSSESKPVKMLVVDILSLIIVRSCYLTVLDYENRSPPSRQKRGGSRLNYG